MHQVEEVEFTVYISGLLAIVGELGLLLGDSYARKSGHTS